MVQVSRVMGLVMLCYFVMCVMRVDYRTGGIWNREYDKALYIIHCQGVVEGMGKVVSRTGYGYTVWYKQIETQSEPGACIWVFL